MRRGFLVSSLAAAAQAAAISARSTYELKESHHVPSTWSKVGPAPKDHVLNLHIGLKQSQFEELERQLWEISDPSHASYGNFLSASEVNELVKPSKEGLDSVLEWLTESAGVAKERLGFSPAKDFITITLPVEEAERLLDTEYSVYNHNSEGHYIVRTPDWSLPSHLHEHIDTIQPTNNFMRPQANGRTLKPVSKDGKWGPAPYKPHYKAPAYPDTSKVCNASAVTPACLRTLYGTIDYKPKAAGKNKIALNNFLGEVQARGDVRSFLKQFRPDAVSEADSFKNVLINGGPPDLEALNTTQITAETGLEGSLDAETIIGITYPTPLIAYSTGGSPPYVPDLLTPTDTNEPYLTWLQYVLAQDDIPQTVSTSYGDNEQTIPYSYAKKTCSLFAQLGARGVSSFHSSGDEGVGYNGTCLSNDGKKRKIFTPEFPASCPYVTTVGGTMDFGPEVVAFDPRNGYVSGGGFSNYFPTPSYQKAVVEKYITGLKGKFDGFYNKTGRGYPDIAASSVAFVVTWAGENVLLDGTSAAAPAAASVISLLNDVRLAAGQKSLGFLNPLLYKILYQGFHDVTSGNAIGCSELTGGPGFPATKGWDAVTGFGTPDFTVLKDLVLKAGGYKGYPRVVRA